MALLLSCTFTARSSWVHYFQAICTMKSSLLYILAVRSYLVRPQCTDKDMLSQRFVQPHMKQSVKCRTWRLLVNFQFWKLQKLADTLPPIQMSESCWWDQEQKEIHHPKFSWSQHGLQQSELLISSSYLLNVVFFMCVHRQRFLAGLQWMNTVDFFPYLLHWRWTKTVLLHRSDRRDRKLFWSTYWHASIVLGQTLKNVKLLKTKTFYSFSSKSQIWLKGLQNLYNICQPQSLDPRFGRLSF